MLVASSTKELERSDFDFEMRRVSILWNTRRTARLPGGTALESAKFSSRTARAACMRERRYSASRTMMSTSSDMHGQREFSQVILDEQVDLLVLVDQRVVIDDGVQLGTVEAAQRFV